MVRCSNHCRLWVKKEQEPGLRFPNCRDFTAACVLCYPCLMSPCSWPYTTFSWSKFSTFLLLHRTASRPQWARRRFQAVVKFLGTGCPGSGPGGFSINRCIAFTEILGIWGQSPGHVLPRKANSFWNQLGLGSWQMPHFLSQTRHKANSRAKCSGRRGLPMLYSNKNQWVWMDPFIFMEGPLTGTPWGFSSKKTCP